MSTEADTHTIPRATDTDVTDEAGAIDASAASPFEGAFEQAMAAIAAIHELALKELVDIGG